MILFLALFADIIGHLLFKTLGKNNLSTLTT